VILHLVEASVWTELEGSATYAPESLFTEGFVHCTGDDELMVDVANRFYSDVGEVLVLSLDEHLLTSEIRWEAPSPRPADWDGSPVFPHVYGPLDLAAVVIVRRLVRGPSGQFVAYANE